MPRDARRSSHPTSRRPSAPLGPGALQTLFDDIDQALYRDGCDHTLRAAMAAAARHGHAPGPLMTWLRSLGGYCDCEVLLNVAPRARRAPPALRDRTTAGGTPPPDIEVDAAPRQRYASRMDEHARKLLLSVLALPAADRAALAGELLRSLDDGTDLPEAAAEQMWAPEIEARAQRALGGAEAGVDADEVLTQLENSLRQG